MTIDREHCRTHSAELREANDCTVYACAIAAQIDYPAMHEYLKEHGREPRRGEDRPSEETDLHAVRNRRISVTPLHLDLTHFETRRSLIESWPRGSGLAWIIQ